MHYSKKMGKDNVFAVVESFINLGNNVTDKSDSSTTLSKIRLIIPKEIQ